MCCCCSLPAPLVHYTTIPHYTIYYHDDDSSFLCSHGRTDGRPSLMGPPHSPSKAAAAHHETYAVHLPHCNRRDAFIRFPSSSHRPTAQQLRDKFLCSSSSFLLVLYLCGGSLYDEPRCVVRPSSISIYAACRAIQASQCHWVDGSLSTKCDHLWGLDYSDFNCHQNGEWAL